MIKIKDESKLEKFGFEKYYINLDNDLVVLRGEIFNIKDNKKIEKALKEMNRAGILEVINDDK